MPIIYVCIYNTSCPVLQYCPSGGTEVDVGSKEICEIISPPFRIPCTSGPSYRYLCNHGSYVFWPPIKYRSCDGLPCQYSLFRHTCCMPAKICVKYRWAHVYKCCREGWRFVCRYIGFRCIRYIEHLYCQCTSRSPWINHCRGGWNPKQCKCIKPFTFVSEHKGHDDHLKPGSVCPITLN